mmetsp:Transcript_38662/g.101990  ORF Transcript_38662/g.101990 Transcript_38662/m.101990 type:complete len:201 (-) Transcript_38662:187-789(-)
MLVETDHLFLKPLPNQATPTTPVGFGFYYMTYKYDPPKLRPVIAKYHDPTQVDPVGPSPVIIHKDLLARLVDPWWELCLELKRDPEANRAFGWVLEMWGWALSAAKAGVRHLVVPELQAEPGGVGIAPIDRYYLYHYTFDLDMGGGWKWSKRQYMSRYPPEIRPPPRHAQRSSIKFVQMMNQAMAALTPWSPRNRGPHPR